MIWVIRGKSSLLATTPVGCIIKHKAQDSTDDGGATPLHYTERKMDINKGCNTILTERESPKTLARSLDASNRKTPLLPLLPVGKPMIPQHPISP